MGCSLGNMLNDFISWFVIHSIKLTAGWLSKLTAGSPGGMSSQISHHVASIRNELGVRSGMWCV